jgi:DNA-binding beta-propeller fold protein YncE
VVGHGDGTVTPVLAVPAGPDLPPQLLPGTPIGVGRLPSAIALAGDGRTAYVTNYGDGTVTPLTLTSGATEQPIAVGKRPWAIAIVS